MYGEKPRFSIAWLMLIISILAAEFGLLRDIWNPKIAPGIIFLPTLTFMLLGLPMIIRGHESRPFWIGFDMAAMTLIGLFWSLIAYAPLFFSIPAQWLSDNQWLYSGNHLIGMVWFVAIYAFPQLVVASTMGCLSARYRVVIERRPRASDVAGPANEGDRKELPRALPMVGECPRPAVE